MSGLPKRVRDAIRDVRARNGTRLDLNGWFQDTALEEIPEEVFALSDLEELDLHGNKIRTVPDRIRNLPKLKSLDLRHNPIETVPDIPGLFLD